MAAGEKYPFAQKKNVEYKFSTVSSISDSCSKGASAFGGNNVQGSSQTTSTSAGADGDWEAFPEAEKQKISTPTQIAPEKSGALDSGAR